MNLSWIGAVIAAVVCVLIAVLVAPLIPAPGGQIVSVVFWILAAVFVVVALLRLVGSGGTRI